MYDIDLKQNKVIIIFIKKGKIINVNYVPNTIYIACFLFYARLLSSTTFLIIHFDNILPLHYSLIVLMHINIGLVMKYYYLTCKRNFSSE